MASSAHVESYREAERKYEVDAAFALPDLAEVDGVSRVSDPVLVTLDAVYLDTSERDLLRRGVTLRRRTGGDDAGWHLKIPAADGSRTELRRPPGRGPGSVPVALARLLPGMTRGRTLAQVARLRTERTVRRLHGPDGEVLAEVVDDRVLGEVTGRAVTANGWREVEVELVAAGSDLADAVETVLLAAGADRSGSVSKVGRLLGAPAREPAGGPDPGTAAAVVLAHLEAQVAELLRRDPAVRLDEPDSVHKMRVATRRLRSALVTFRPVFDPEVTEPLRAELAWLAGLLGVPRDAEVMREHLTGMLAAEPAGLVLGPVARRIRLELSGAYRDGRDVLLKALEVPRYLALLDALEELLRAPPLTDRGRLPAAAVLPRRARRTWRRLRAAVEAAEAAEAGPERDHALHEVRKSAKRARYAGEALAPAFGPDAAAFAAAVEEVQEVLGDHQDSVVSRALLRHLGAQAFLAGENGFSFGRLHALEQVRADAAQARFDGAWRAASRRRLRRWMD